ncbi:hypothetical protein DM02DRAFT_692625 [Periconia macrospinosa]|uniref:Uncharacterized protein n=1 Tax=Periconia macrospinosa TaxID=97972 RepID=A0A2V1D984_9PLEO|nr:hypothetical protein DM02DRAFT_692625 [Periconia macrospinosa]
MGRKGNDDASERQRRWSEAKGERRGEDRRRRTTEDQQEQEQGASDVDWSERWMMYKSRADLDGRGGRGHLCGQAASQSEPDKRWTATDGSGQWTVGSEWESPIACNAQCAAWVGWLPLPHPCNDQGAAAAGARRQASPAQRQHTYTVQSSQEGERGRRQASTGTTVYLLPSTSTHYLLLLSPTSYRQAKRETTGVPGALALALALAALHPKHHHHRCAH